MSRNQDAPTRSPLMPADTPDYMADAWAGCMSWAIGKPEVRQAFEEETGCRYTSPKTGMDRLIDEATGHGIDYVKAFILWANVHVWGSLDGDSNNG